MSKDMLIKEKSGRRKHIKELVKFVKKVQNENNWKNNLINE